MVFLVDKYKVNNEIDIKFNRNIYKQLIYNINPDAALLRLINQLKNAKTVEQSNKCIIRHYYKGGLTDEEYQNRYVNLPNLFIYGPSGSGKKTFIRLLLESMFNKTINNTTKITHQIVGYGNSTEDKEIEQSNYHIIIEPDNTGFDRYVMQEIIGEYAQHAPLCLNGCQTSFRIVLINNADNLSPYAQKALRCTMEKYYKTCKFILCCNQASKVIRALRSRCLQVRMPRPTDNDIYNLVHDVCYNERICISNEHIDQIVRLSKRNIKTTYSLLDIYKINSTNTTVIDDSLYVLPWIECLQKVVNVINMFINAPKINNIFTQTTMDIIRDHLYTIFITNISGNNLITQFMNLMMKSIKFHSHLLPKILEIISLYEVRMTKGKKIIIHMEALIINILYQIQLFKMR
jgi:replication factor C subunit 3/5